MIGTHSSQRGSTLVVSLMLLIVMTLVAVAGINISTVNTRIIRNVQAQYTAEQGVQTALEQLISSTDNLYNPDNYPTVISLTDLGLLVEVDRPDCLRNRSASGYTARVTNAAQITPEDVTWEIVARVVDSDGNAGDPITGAHAEIHQGVSMRMTADSCT